MTSWLLLFLGLSVPAVTDQSAGSVRRIAIGDRGRLELIVPAEWRETVRDATAGARTITFSPASGANFTIIITVIPRKDGRRSEATERASRQADIHAMVQRSASQIGSRAVERPPAIEPLGGPDFAGYYFSVTDTATEPGGFAYLTQGAVEANDVLVSFTILAHDGNAPSRKTMLEALTNARWVGEVP